MVNGKEVAGEVVSVNTAAKTVSFTTADGNVVVGDLVVVDRQELRGELAKGECYKHNSSLSKGGDLEVVTGETFRGQNEHAAGGTIFPFIMISIMPMLQRLPKNLHLCPGPMTLRNDSNTSLR